MPVRPCDRSRPRICSGRKTPEPALPAPGRQGPPDRPFHKQMPISNPPTRWAKTRVTITDLAFQVKLPIPPTFTCDRPCDTVKSIRRRPFFSPSAFWGKFAGAVHDWSPPAASREACARELLQARRRWLIGCGIGFPAALHDRPIAMIASIRRAYGFQREPAAED